MKFRINYTLPNGAEDSIIIEGDDIEQMREQANQELSRRNATDPWSEELDA